MRQEISAGEFFGRWFDEVVEYFNNRNDNCPAGRVGMRRREFGAGLGAAAVAWPLAARAQRKSPVVGVLVSAAPPHPFAEHFRRGMRALGYAEGQNIALDIHYTEARS